MSVLGVEVWRGDSVFTGEPIVVVATGLDGRSRNRATGRMIQIWILPVGSSPVVAVQTGTDGAVCGSCPLRPIRRGGCYVNVGYGPLGVWKAWKAGRYVKAETVTRARELLERCRVPLRLGAWGDPGAVPDRVWTGLLSTWPYGWTGYTHAWRRLRSSLLRRWTMASVESQEDAELAHSWGWRTFRITSRRELEEELEVSSRGVAVRIGKGWEVLCPKATGRSVCAQCLGCGGTRGRGLASVRHPAHGPQVRKAEAVITEDSANE